jgi:hypothetical protein
MRTDAHVCISLSSSSSSSEEEEEDVLMRQDDGTRLTTRTLYDVSQEVPMEIWCKIIGDMACDPRGIDGSLKNKFHRAFNGAAALGGFAITFKEFGLWTTYESGKKWIKAIYYRETTRVSFDAMPIPSHVSHALYRSRKKNDFTELKNALMNGRLDFLTLLYNGGDKKKAKLTTFLMSGRPYCEPYVKKCAEEGKPTVYGYKPSVVYETDNTTTKIWTGGRLMNANEKNGDHIKNPRLKLDLKSEWHCDAVFNKRKPTVWIVSKTSPKTHFLKLFYKNGVLHHDNPKKASAIIRMGDKTVKFWHMHGVRSRIGGPSVTGLPKTEYHFGGQLDNYGDAFGPAVICKDRDEYWQHGMKHRDYRLGPAIVYKNERKKKNDDDVQALKKEEYWQYDRLHRPCRKGPAIIYQKQGNADYYEHGQRHSTVGPAYIRSGLEPEYYIRGIHYKNKLDWQNQVDYMKNNPGKHL